MYKKIFYLIVRIKLIVPKMLHNLIFPRIFFIRILWKFVLHGRIEENKFVLEEISSYILQRLEAYNVKAIIVTFEMPVTTNMIKINNDILIN